MKKIIFICLCILWIAELYAEDAYRLWLPYKKIQRKKFYHGYKTNFFPLLLTETDPAKAADRQRSLFVSFPGSLALQKAVDKLSSANAVKIKSILLSRRDNRRMASNVINHQNILAPREIELIY